MDRMPARFDMKFSVLVEQAQQHRARRRQVADHERVTTPDRIVGGVDEHVVSGRVDERQARTIDIHERLVSVVDDIVQLGVERRRGRRVDVSERLAGSQHSSALHWGRKSRGPGLGRVQPSIQLYPAPFGRAEGHKVARRRRLGVASRQERALSL